MSGLNRSEICLDTGHYDQALKDLNRVIEIAPHAAQAYYSRGRAHEALGNTHTAQEDFATASSMGYYGEWSEQSLDASPGILMKGGLFHFKFRDLPVSV